MEIHITEHCPDDIRIQRDGVSYTQPIHMEYPSKTTGMTRGVNVLLPISYNEAKKYPVMYILHGIFGDEYSMVKDGVIGTIAQNLAVDGEASEMILVFPDMFAKTNPDDKPAFTNESSAIYDSFINDLVNDLMPFIKDNYSIAEGRDNTAISGFSMGGREALYIGAIRSDLFGYTCAIAPAPGIIPTEDSFMKHNGTIPPEQLAIADLDNTPHLFIICVGTADTIVRKYPKEYNEILTKNGFSGSIFYEIEGAGHDGGEVNSGYYNFIRYAFKN